MLPIYKRTGDVFVKSVEKNPSQYYYAANTEVILTPSADSGWFFDAWEGANSIDVIDNLDNTYSILMNENKSLSAVFHINYILTVYSSASSSCSGSTSGELQLDPPGGTYTKDTQVSLIINYGEHTTFEGWGGENAGDIIDEGDENYSIIMNGDKTITISFGLVEYNLEITINGGGIIQEISNCNKYFFGTMSEDYVEGYTVILSPQDGTFNNWSGTNSDDIIDNDDDTYSIIMESHKVIEANFQ